MTGSPFVADDYIGKIIGGKYRVDELIGEGGMGRVYRARQMTLEKSVVLKILRHDLLSDERTVARFEREARAASRLNHPNSISVLDFGQALDGALYIVMEYVSGHDLHWLLSHEWPLPEKKMVDILSQVLSALADAHQAGVIHRDLKPENIMVEDRRGEAFVKVLDFGIAKIVDSQGGDGPALTKAGFVCGTPEYMSPEQARGVGLDARSDLYSVGVILYQLVTGLLPFDADSAVAFATKHLNEEPVKPSARRQGLKISIGLEALILKALEKDPNRRHQSAEEFRQALQALNLGDISSMKSDAQSMSSQPSSGKAPVALIQASSSQEQLSDDLELPPSWESQSARRSLGYWLGAFVLGAAIFSSGAWFLLQKRKTNVAPQPALVVPTQSNSVTQKSVPMPLFEAAPPERRDQKLARQWLAQGDLSFEQGDKQKSIDCYEKAFRLDPLPAVSLRLGELHFQQGALELAQGWWLRHLRDAPTSAAKSYINERMALAR